MNMDQVAAFKQSPFAYLHRDTSSDILKIVLNSEKEIILQDSHEFAADSLFCEWAYVIDLDINSFEVYKGFNKTPIEGQRFSGIKNEGTYYPVRLLISYPLSKLPSEEDFLKFFEESISF